MVNSAPIKPSEQLRMGLIKSVFFSDALQGYDSEYEPAEDEDESKIKPPIPKMLSRAAWTALVLQLVSLLDEGLENFIEQRYADTQRCRTFGNRVQFLASKGELKWPIRVEALRLRRNALAHEDDQLADWEEWRRTFFTVKRELEHLGVVADLEPPPELLYNADDHDEDDQEDEDA